MRNYVFISNKGAQDIIEEHISTKQFNRGLEMSKNAKGKVIHFYNAHMARQILTFVEDQRNIIAFDLTVLPMSADEKRSAKATIRSLTRISDEINLIIKQFNELRVANL